MSAANPTVPDPTHIGKFEIEKKLGAGAMGMVYKARDPELGRMVAIKTIRLEGLAASQQSLDDLTSRFKREARVAADLRHPNIVTIHDIGSVPGNSYLVMEYVEGDGLDAVIKKNGKMSVERAAAIGAQVADALDYAWRQKKLVHRDIKPANIMIEPGDHVKVTDFGIAKLMSSETVDNLTATGSLLGTPSYMSPEQARGRKLDGSSDLFSVGCVLYEMVCGQRAFRGESITALIYKIISEEPPPLREIDPTVSEEMVRIIAKALSKTPETRYESGRELADDLLKITRPGYVPTLRSTDVPTLPPDAAPGDVPTIQASVTAQGVPTIASAPTVARPAAAAVAPTLLTPTPVPGAPPPLPALPPLPPKVGAAPPQRPTPRAHTAPPAAAARRKGGGAGLIVGLSVAGLLLLALAVGGGYYMVTRSAPATEPELVQATPVPEATPLVHTAPAASQPSEATPAPVLTLTPPSAGPATRPAPPAAGAGAGATTASRPPTGVSSGVPATTASSGAAAAPPAPVAAGDEFGYLDELPSEEADGRATGEALAQKYRSGGSSGTSSTTRFRQRPKVPRGVTVQERPAVATLLYVNSVQEAFHRKNSRYGTLRELADAGLLVLDVPFDAGGFKRARYAFKVSVESDGYRADALPQGPIGRPFLVDDSGIVRLEE